MDPELDNKVAIVTGSSSGVGRGIASRLLAEGARVAIVGRDGDRVDLATAEFESVAGAERVLGVSADVSTAGGTKEIVAAVLGRWGTVDILVNNAGEPAHRPFLESDDDAWHYDFDLKLMAVVRLARLVIPVMRSAGGGVVLNVLSSGAKVQPAGSAPTSIVRAGGMALTNVLSKEFAADQIRVNAVVLGVVKSGQWERAWAERETGETLDAFYEQLAQSVPAGRLASPEEVGDLVAFLASPRAAYISGTAINLDGAKTAVA